MHERRGERDRAISSKSLKMACESGMRAWRFGIFPGPANAQKSGNFLRRRIDQMMRLVSPMWMDRNVGPEGGHVLATGTSDRKRHFVRAPAATARPPPFTAKDAAHGVHRFNRRTASDSA